MSILTNILDKGYVELLEVFGDELTVVNAARVSYGSKKDILDERDIKLITYLKIHKHFSPFRHIFFRFIIKAPEVVMRQMLKHVVGIEATSDSQNQLHGFNELSGRYKPIEDFYMPEVWRKQSPSSKQASDGILDEPENEKAVKIFNETNEMIQKCYTNLLDLGVAKEQARLILPLNMYTSVMWTMSFQALANFIELRDEPTAQYEIQLYAKVMKNMMQEKCPVLSKLWFEN
jgi:thymidylate synthase (FAD)